MKNREYIEQLANDLRRHIEQCKAWKDSAQKRLAHLERVVLNSVDAPTQTIRLDRYTGERLGPSNAEKCKKVDEAMEWFTNPPSLTPKPAYDPTDVAFNRAKPWHWQVPTAAPVDCLADLRAENARLLAERDALCARIEAGRVMYGGMYGHENKFEMWTFEHVDTDTMTARLIDIAPIADAGEMADERRGERRKGLEQCALGTRLYQFRTDAVPFGRTDKRKSDRRTNPTGTRAVAWRMGTTMPPLDRARELIALRQKATAGEWRPSNFGFQILTEDSWKTICQFSLGARRKGEPCEKYEWEQQEANSAFTAAAANHAAAVAQEYIDAEVKIAAIREAFAQWESVRTSRDTDTPEWAVLVALIAALED